MGNLPFEEHIVTTPTSNLYVGCKCAVNSLCGVSIIRSGEAMENALRACVQGISIGKILVHRCARPQLPSRLPPAANARVTASCVSDSLLWRHSKSKRRAASCVEWGRGGGRGC